MQGACWWCCGGGALSVLPRGRPSEFCFRHLSELGGSNVSEVSRTGTEALGPVPFFPLGDTGRTSCCRKKKVAQEKKVGTL
jgi:hypothetical protein